MRPFLPLFSPFFTPETTYFPCKTPMLIDYSLLIVNNRSQHGIIEFLCIRSLTKDREHNGKKRIDFQRPSAGRRPASG